MPTIHTGDAQLERESPPEGLPPAPSAAPATSSSAFETPLDSLADPVGAVLASHAFASASALRTLLVYLWQHRTESISEYAVAVEALGRSSNFDPKLDATVRVQVSRLRQRLEKYYEQEGRERSERLVIPLGCHQLRVEACKPRPAIQPDGQAPVPPPARRRLILALATLCAALSVACLVLAVSLYRSRTAPNRPIQEAGRFWKSFFANGRPTRIVLPSPVFFSYRNGVMLRDITINDFLDGHSSKLVTAASQIFGRPGLADNYTVTSDTFAAVQLARYLEGCGLDTSLHSSADAPLAALDNENMVAIGTRGTLNAVKLYLDRMTMRSLQGDNDVEIRDARPGEPKRINLRHESENQERAIWPGVIGMLPGRTGQTRLLVLTSRHTSALVAFLTSANGQDQLDRIWNAHGSPEYYEIVVAAEMNGENLVRFWPVALHPIPAQR